MDKLKIGVLYLVFVSGGMWHVLDVFQKVMPLLTSPIMIGLGVWVFWECNRKTPTDKKDKFFLWSIGIIVSSFVIECLGVWSGWVFGKYEYGSTLYPSIAGVPISICFAWYVILTSSFAVVKRVVPKSFIQNQFSLACIVALVMVIFDFFMEPAAINLSYWSWKNGHVPIQNYLSWFTFSFVLARISIHLNLPHDKMSKIVFHSYFAQFIYFGLVGFKLYAIK